MARTIKDLASEAVAVQNACNLVAVIKGMDRALADLREHGLSGDTLAQHPVTRAWADKVSSLTGNQLATFADMMGVHSACDKMAGE